MAAPIVKLKGNTVSLGSTATNISTASLLRLYNNTASSVTISLYNSDTVSIGSVVLGNNQVLFLEKDPTDVVNSSATIPCSAIAFR